MDVTDNSLSAESSTWIQEYVDTVLPDKQYSSFKAAEDDLLNSDLRKKPLLSPFFPDNVNTGRRCVTGRFVYAHTHAFMHVSCM